jgi:hydrogenase maturation factor HypF (carbamoyltransferase family)
MQIRRHNELRDLTAQMMNEVSHNVTVEPVLQALSGEVFQNRSTTTEVGARLDISADGFW